LLITFYTATLDLLKGKITMQQIVKVDRGKIMQVIERLECFDRFTHIEKQRIVNFYTQFFAYERGEVIIREGNHDTSFYILLSGSISIVKGSKKVAIGKVEAGDFFGEISFLTKQPRTASAIADETAIVIRVDDGMLGKLNVQIREKIKDKIIDKLVRALVKMNNAFVTLLY
jgi:CRP/FNR family transcriptional regulator, cyclic AMP receptor protein